jgi:hypothetical protein
MQTQKTPESENRRSDCKMIALILITGSEMKMSHTLGTLAHASRKYFARFVGKRMLGWALGFFTAALETFLDFSLSLFMEPFDSAIKFDVKFASFLFSPWGLVRAEIALKIHNGLAEIWKWWFKCRKNRKDEIFGKWTFKINLN